MKLGLIKNQNILFEKELFGSINSYDQSFIATAFIDRYTISFLRKEMNRKDVKNKRKIKLLIGLYGRFNLKEDLKELQKIQQLFPGQIEVRISDIERFHWKMYFFQNQGSESILYIGSSNFTRTGLSSPGEVVLKVQGSSKMEICHSVLSNYNKVWSKAIRIEKFPISKYQNAPKSIHSAMESIDNKEIRKLFRKFKVRKNIIKKVDLAHAKIGLVSSQSFFTKEEEKSIGEKKSNWEKQNYDFIGYNVKSFFSTITKSDYFFLREKSGYGSWFYSLNKVMDWDDFNIGDQKYFIAYKSISRRRNLQNQKFRRILKELNISIYFKDGGRLDSVQSQSIFKMFNVNVSERK